MFDLSTYKIRFSPNPLFWGCTQYFPPNTPQSSVFLVGRYFGRYFEHYRIWWELFKVWWESFFSSKWGLGPSKRWSWSPFRGKKGVPTKRIILKCTNQVFLRYWFGKYQEIPTEYQPKIPNQYTTLVRTTFSSFNLEEHSEGSPHRINVSVRLSVHPSVRNTRTRSFLM